jgi:hypothetical protein
LNRQDAKNAKIIQRVLGKNLDRKDTKDAKTREGIALAMSVERRIDGGRRSMIEYGCYPQCSAGGACMANGTLVPHSGCVVRAWAVG